MYTAWNKLAFHALNAGDLSIADESGEITLKTGSGVSVGGDAIINNRKKKLIPSYELEVKGTWTGKGLSPHACQPPNAVWDVSSTSFTTTSPLTPQEMCHECRQCEGQWTG